MYIVCNIIEALLILDQCMDVNLILRQLGKGNNVTVFKFPENARKQTEWLRLRKLPNIEFKLHKHPESASNILNNSSSSYTMNFYVQMVILT